MVEVVKKRFLLPFGFVDVVILTKQMKELFLVRQTTREVRGRIEGTLYHPVSRTGHGRTCQLQVGVSYGVRTHRLEQNTIYNLYDCSKSNTTHPSSYFQKVLKSET